MQDNAVGFRTPPAGGKKECLACRHADASCGRQLNPPELLLSCRGGRPAAADRPAAASSAPLQRTLDIASALHCPESHTGNTFGLRHSVGEVSVKPLNVFFNIWCEVMRTSASTFEYEEMLVCFVIVFIYTHEERSSLLSYMKDNF